MRPANRINKVEEYYFSTKLAEIRALIEKGRNIINLGVGNPDLPTHPEVLKELTRTAHLEGSNYYQSYKGLPSLRNAFGNWYKRVYGLDLNPNTEILPLMGSKEAIMHVHMAFCNPGDTVLVPDPGYLTYSSTAKLLDLDIKYYNLREENGWLPDFEEIEMLAGNNCKIMWINYPNMPTGALADTQTLKKLNAFAKRKNILLVNDNPYSLILNDQTESILAHCEDFNNVMELNSLSKSHNMAGWRVGVISGSETNISYVLRVKSNFDSGMFKPIQEAAVAALQLNKEWHANLNSEYSERRELLWHFLDKLKCTYDKNTSGMFVWARIPEGFKNGVAFSDYLLDHKDIFATPGSLFGSNGEEYIRLSLCAPKVLLKECLQRVANKAAIV